MLANSILLQRQNDQLPYDGTNQQVQWVRLLALSAVLIRHPSFVIQYKLVEFNCQELCILSKLQTTFI